MIWNKYCSYHCYDTEYAEDLTQETFVNFFAKLSDYHYQGKTMNYLYTIAGNLCKNHCKKKKDVLMDDEFLLTHLINSMKEYVWVCHVEKNMVQNLSQKNKVSNIKSDVNGVELRIISKDKPVENATRENATLEDVFLYYFGEKAGVNNGTI